MGLVTFKASVVRNVMKNYFLKMVKKEKSRFRLSGHFWGTNFCCFCFFSIFVETESIPFFKAVVKYQQTKKAFLSIRNKR